MPEAIGWAKRSVSIQKSIITWGVTPCGIIYTHKINAMRLKIALFSLVVTVVENRNGNYLVNLFAENNNASCKLYKLKSTHPTR